MEPSVKPCMPFGSGAGGGNVVRRRQVGGGTNQTLLHLCNSPGEQKLPTAEDDQIIFYLKNIHYFHYAASFYCTRTDPSGFHFIALLLRERSKTWFSCRFRRADPRLPWHCPGAGAGLSPSQGEQKWQKRYKNLLVSNSTSEPPTQNSK